MTFLYFFNGFFMNSLLAFYGVPDRITWLATVQPYEVVTHRRRDVRGYFLHPLSLGDTGRLAAAPQEQHGQSPALRFRFAA
jgi:hypothetical protein